MLSLLKRIPVKSQVALLVKHDLEMFPPMTVSQQFVLEGDHWEGIKFLKVTVYFQVGVPK